MNLVHVVSLNLREDSCNRITCMGVLKEVKRPSICPYCYQTLIYALCLLKEYNIDLLKDQILSKESQLISNEEQNLADFPIIQVESEEEQKLSESELKVLYESIVPSRRIGIKQGDIVYIAYSAILFVWCVLWGLIGLIRLKRKKDA